MGFVQVYIGQSGNPNDPTPPVAAVEAPRLIVADELVTRAEQTGARVRFIEDAALLEPVGGVGALLRFRL